MNLNEILTKPTVELNLSLPPDLLFKPSEPEMSSAGDLKPLIKPNGILKSDI